MLSYSRAWLQRLKGLKGLNLRYESWRRLLLKPREQAHKEKEMAAGEMARTKNELERVYTQTCVQLCNVYVLKESLRHGALKAGQVACKIAAT